MSQSRYVLDFDLRVELELKSLTLNLRQFCVLMFELVTGRVCKCPLGDILDGESHICEFQAKYDANTNSPLPLEQTFRFQTKVKYDKRKQLFSEHKVFKSEKLWVLP